MVRNRGLDHSMLVRESLRIGVVQGDPDLQFHQIRDLAIDSAGGIWVSDSHETIRHYGPGGEYLGSVGGEGQGPGEASEGYGDVWTGRGTVLAHTYDGTLKLFTENGSFVGHREMRMGPRKYLIPLGASGDEWNLYFVETPISEAELLRETWTVVRAPVTESGFDSLFALPGGLRTGRGSHTSFFYGPPGIDADSKGNVFYSHPLVYQIDVFDDSGKLVQVVSREIPGVPFTPNLRDEVMKGAREAWRDLMMAGGTPREEDVAQTTEDALPESPPEHLPFLQAVFVSADGHIWAQRGDRHPRPAMRAVAEVFGFIRAVWPPEWRAPLHFDLFSPDGLYRGSVVLPEDFVPMAVTQDRIIGSIRDDLDIQYVVAFSVEEGAS